LSATNWGIYAQQLDPNSRIKLVLSDGTELSLLSTLNLHGNDYSYYYLPASLRISVSNNRPEISLLVYNDKDNQGGILHFLLTWGLTGSQEREANILLKQKISDSAFIAGQVMVNEGSPGIGITTDKPLARILGRYLNQNSHIPLMSGGKYAVSIKLASDEVKEILDAKKNYSLIRDIAIQMNFTYGIMVQKGFIRTAINQNWTIEMPLRDIIKFL
jgi:hypothetical protein